MTHGQTNGWIYFVKENNGTSITNGARYLVLGIQILTIYGALRSLVYLVILC